MRLFRYLNQPSYYKDHVELAENFNLEQNYNNYVNPEVAKYFYQIYQYGLLPRGQIFSIFYEEHLQQAIALYKLFFYAKDYQTFYNTAVWARQNINEGVFLYSLSVAVVHRNDTYGVVLPPIYEVYPYYFYNSDVLQKASHYKQQYYGLNSAGGGYTINANYSGFYLNLNPEQSLGYFTEDIGLNSFYYYYNIYYPFWLGGQDFDYQNDRRGEFFYYIYQQILARYYLERLSNNFGEISYFNYEVPFENGYYPSLQYSNGLPFPVRPNFANLYEYFYNYGQKTNNQYSYSYTRVQDYDRRIRDAIDQGYIYTPQGQKIDLYSQKGLNVLGNLIESNPDSPNYQYYGALQIYARHLLGYAYQPLSQYQLAPSALEHFETSLRDPAFYQFYKRVLFYFQQYQSNLTAYYEQDLIYQGVEVTNVQFDRLVTYFDYFYSDLNNALYVTPEEYNNEKLQVRARQYRLNHKAFTYKIYVNSNQAQKASVRIYLGPKYDEYGRYLNISQNRQNFVQFDHFIYELQAGENVIERNSRQSYFYQNDRTSFRELYQNVLAALNGNGQFSVNYNEAYFGFPRRLVKMLSSSGENLIFCYFCFYKIIIKICYRFLLPKGTYGGFEYQFYVILSPYLPYQVQSDSKYYYPKVGSGAQYLDNYPLGYPFERPAYYDQVYFNIPNSYVYSAKIYHRDVEDINASTASGQ